MICKKNNKEKYLEMCPNRIIQVLSEFSSFLFAITYDCKDNQELHNAIIDSRRVHLRALLDFFNNKGSKKDDLFSSDFVNENLEKYKISDCNGIITMINKQSLHITKKRGKCAEFDKNMERVCAEVVEKIKIYIRDLDSSIKPNYANDYASDEAKKIRADVLIKTLEFTSRIAKEK